MGLDQYAYAAAQSGDRERYYDSGEYVNGEFVSTLTEPKEIAYWRKHPNLQGWMENLWLKKNPDILNDRNAVFNCIELELTWEDLDQLGQDILDSKVSELNTTGFFFGEASDDYYREKDLQFIKDAKAELFLGLKVFYNSSW
jgi:hypothetical protein